MPFAKYRIINGERWRLHGVIITDGRSDIERAKKIAKGIREFAGRRVRREGNVLYTRQ